MPAISNIVLTLTATTTALIAGLLYAYSCSVNPGLAKLTDTQYVAAMQSINRAIQNPLFFISFMGTLVLLPVCTFMHYGQLLSVRFWLLASATLVYAIGVFGITMFGNVPLNNALENFNIASATPEAITGQRTQFEAAWNSFHTIRTIASVLALLLVIIACISDNKISLAGDNS